MCSYVHLLAKYVGFSASCCHNMIIVDKIDKKLINNEYTIKQYIILMRVHTYIL